jgi:uncharacterized delta-60 repeat protein
MKILIITLQNQRLLLLFVFFVASIFFPTKGFAQNLTLDSSFNASVTDAAANNYVSAVQPDGKILVGGEFRFVNGVQRNFLARLNADGTLDTNFNVGGSGPANSVLDIVVLGDGKILIAGSFASYNGAVINKIVRLNSNGTLDTTFNSGGAGATGTGRITSIVVQTDGKIVAAGESITGYNGIISNGIFRMNADGTFDSSFVSGFATSPFNIQQIASQTDGKIVIAGSFTLYGGVTKNGVIRVNSNGTVDTGFNSAGVGVATNFEVAGLAIQTDGKILIGGNFPRYNTISRNRIARLNIDGTLDTTFNPPLFESSVESIAVQTDGKIIAVGTFDVFSIGDETIPIIKLNINGSLDSTPLIITDNIGYHAVLQPDNKILLTGFFNDFPLGTSSGILRLNSNGSIDSAFNTSLTGFGVINSIVQQSDGKTIVGGRFRKVNGGFSNNIARFNADGTFDNTFVINRGPLFNKFSNSDFVNSLAIQPDGKILVGGFFASFDHSPQKALVRLNPNGSIDSAFGLSGDIDTDFNNIEDIVVLPDGNIIITGIMYDSLVQPKMILRLNSDGSIDSAFNLGGLSANSSVLRVIRQPDGKYIICGFFTTYNGITRPRIARLNVDGTLDTTFNPGTGANAVIYDIALQPDGKIIIGGNFTLYNGTSVNRIARLNSDGTLDSSFNVGTGANNTVNSLALQSNGKIIFGGSFGSINGVTRNLLARLNTNGTLDTELVSGFDFFGFVNAMLLRSDGKLIVGGNFQQYNGSVRKSILRLTQTAVTTPKYVDFDGDGKTDISVFRPSVGEWYFQRSSNSAVNGAQFGSSTDKPIPADYTGDGKTDIAFFRPSSGEWFILRSEDFSFYAFPFGLATDIPSPGDFDGDGKADQAVFRPSNGVWYVNKSTGGVTIQPFGVNGDRTVVADYDGDGKSDIAIFRPSVGEWYYLRSSDSQVRGAQFGAGTDKTVQGDYTGDGKADFAFFRPSTGQWFVLRSEDSSFFASPFGISTDIPTIGDYDGDGKFDQAVFRPSNGVWYINRSTAGVQIQQFGTGTDLPLPSYYLP